MVAVLFQADSLGFWSGRELRDGSVREGVMGASVRGFSHTYETCRRLGEQRNIFIFQYGNEPHLLVSQHGHLIHGFLISTSLPNEDNKACM